MRATAALLVASLVGGCFANPRHRRIAKVAEGTAVVGGVLLNLWANTNDCGERRPGTLVMDCPASVGQASNAGILLIFAGLAGFAATMMHQSARKDPDDRSDDEEQEVEPRDNGVFATPQAFCPAMWANNIPQAEAALATYVKSVGAMGFLSTSEALHAWLSRQECVTVEDEADPADPSIHIRVSVRDVKYRIDISAAPFIVLIAE